MKRQLLTPALLLLTALLMAFGLLRINDALTAFIDNSNLVCKGQTFTSAEEAIRAMEAEARTDNDPSLDYCPPYEVKHTFDLDGNTVVLYSYCTRFDGQQADDLAFRALKRHSDGSLSFDATFGQLRLRPYQSGDSWYFFSNIHTSHGERTLSLLYLPASSAQDVYVDGVKAEKERVTIDGHEFFLCHALTARDTFFRNLTTPVDQRHRVEIK